MRSGVVRAYCSTRGLANGQEALHTVSATQIHDSSIHDAPRNVPMLCLKTMQFTSSSSGKQSKYASAMQIHGSLRRSPARILVPAHAQHLACTSIHVPHTPLQLCYRSSRCGAARVRRGGRARRGKRAAARTAHVSLRFALPPRYSRGHPAQRQSGFAAATQIHDRESA